MRVICQKDKCAQIVQSWVVMPCCQLISPWVWLLIDSCCECRRQGRIKTASGALLKMSSPFDHHISQGVFPVDIRMSEFNILSLCYTTCSSKWEQIVGPNQVWLFLIFCLAHFNHNSWFWQQRLFWSCMLTRVPARSMQQPKMPLWKSLLLRTVRWKCPTCTPWTLKPLPQLRTSLVNISESIKD